MINWKKCTHFWTDQKSDPCVLIRSRWRPVLPISDSKFWNEQTFAGNDDVCPLSILDGRVSFSPFIYRPYYARRLPLFPFIAVLIRSYDNTFLASRSGRVNYFACITITTVCNNCYRAHLFDIHVSSVVSIATDAHGSSHYRSLRVGLFLVY
jgi:hypothetical protein